MEDRWELYTVAWNQLGMVVIVVPVDKMEEVHLMERNIAVAELVEHLMERNIAVVDLEEHLMEMNIAVADLEEPLTEHHILQLVEEYQVLNIETC